MQSSSLDASANFVTNLFDLIPDAFPDIPWTPEELPILADEPEIMLDFETTGVRWWAGDKPFSFGYILPKSQRYGYVAWGHRNYSGPQHDEATVIRWFNEQVRGKRITNLSTKFEVHMALRMGVNFEELGNQVSDVSHYAALLDDYRFEFSLASLCRDFLPKDEQKVTSVSGIQLDPKRMSYYPPGMVAQRAIGDVRQVWLLRNIFWPRLTAEGLHKVRLLEDEFIYPVVEMEENGTKIDVELLDKWNRETARAVEQLYMDLTREVGFRINVNSGPNMEALFEKLSLPIARTPKGNASFTSAILKAIQHPTIQKVVRLRKILDLRKVYIVPYARLVDRVTGTLRYAIHQLPSLVDEYDDDSTAGTISGRCSSTRLSKSPEEGFGIQRTIKPAKQRVMFGFDEDDTSHDHEIWPIRRLHIPDRSLGSDVRFLSADAMQIEYRLFAIETGSARLKAIYDKNPRASFHKETHRMWKQYKPDLTYRRNKDTNFAKIYGAGIRKIAMMLEFIDKERWQELMHDDNWRAAPELREVFEIDNLYNTMIPETRVMIRQAQRLAETRGFIRSIMGRRSRFPNGERSHKALNTRIQPSAADIMKLKTIELHKARKKTGFLLRFIVHDEVDGCAVNGMETVRAVNEILNRQSFNLPIPILWETNSGPNWLDLTEFTQ